MKFGAKTRNEMNLELGYHVLYLAFKSFTALFVLNSFLILHWQWVWEFNLFTQKVMLISLFLSIFALKVQIWHIARRSIGF